MDEGGYMGHFTQGEEDRVKWYLHENLKELRGFLGLTILVKLALLMPILQGLSTIIY